MSSPSPPILTSTPSIGSPTVAGSLRVGLLTLTIGELSVLP
jgi:hypothetical protein